MVQAPMLSSPLKQTGEIDWITPLKNHIRMSYGDDPDKYSEECATLNRLRQDMRGAGADSASGRDLLYRYYGQLELLDLRFPIDENHIKISFTWLDAFTLKPTSQYSLAYEKASVIFNIAAVLSCHAAVQNRSEDAGLKTAYHSFQASAGMFTYINENFLHAPSIDLSRDTVKALINITLAQAQEVFLEKQLRDGKKPALIAKLAAQAHFLYSQAKEGLEAEAVKNVFDPTWLKLIQTKAHLLSATSDYNQALADDENNQSGSAIARLQLADKSNKQAQTLAKSFPASPSASSNLGSDTASTLQGIAKRQVDMVQEKLTALIKDNDFIYHQPVVAEASLAAVTKMPAAKAIPIPELYQGQDIQRIIGPDIFQKIVPLSVTESASMYDEEKAKLIRSEAEKVETANGEMAASLDYLKLPNSLNILKGGLDQELEVDPEFERWCRTMADHESFGRAFEQLQKDKAAVLDKLNKCTKQLDMEESVCEKMRSKYSGEWTLQPSSGLTSTPRSLVKSYRETVSEATNSDNQLLNTSRQYEAEFEEMRQAGERGEADVLYQQAIIKAGSGGKGKAKSPAEGTLLDEDYGEGGPSVADQIAKVEEILRKLNLVKRERNQVLKDLKEKVHTDDISHVLILNKKAIGGQENQLFQAELEKFRSHQNRLISTVHKQQSLLKELTKTYGDLLQDKRVRSDQQKFETINRTRSTVLSKYKKVFTAHSDLIAGLLRAQAFYSEMKESVDSLEQNVEAFVGNRKAEGAQLLNEIEQRKSGAASSSAAADQERLQELMSRMSMEPSASTDRPPPLPAQPSFDSKPISSYSLTNADPRFTIPPREAPAPIDGSTHPLNRDSQPSNVGHSTSAQPGTPGLAGPMSLPYNPMTYPGRQPTPHGQQYPSQNHRFQQSPPPQGMQIGQPPRPQSQQSFYPQQATYTPQAHPPQVQSPLQQMTFGNPSAPYQPHLQYPPQQQQQQQQYPQHPSQSFSPPPGQYAQPYPSYPYSTSSPQPYNMPQNYVPPPPPPGPPGGGSSTQYPANSSGVWASGPGGYANYQRPPAGQKPQDGQNPGQPHGQVQGQGDMWAGLSAWR